MFAVQYDKVEKKLFGLRKKTTHPLRLIDEEGVIRPVSYTHLDVYKRQRKSTLRYIR